MKKILGILLLAGTAFADCSAMGWAGQTTCSETTNFMSIVAIGLIFAGVGMIYIALKGGKHEH